MPGTQPAVEIAIERAPSPKPGRVVGQPAEGEHLVVVVERLAHAHQHDVGDPAAVAPRLARRPQQLLEDLAAGEVAAEAHGAGGAERARQRAARLRRDADRAPVAVPHQHRLDREPVQRAEPRLHRLVGRALLLVEDQVGERQLAGESRADGLRQRRHLVPGGREVARHTLPDLLSPIRWLAPVSEQRHCRFELHESKGIHDSRPGRRRSISTPSTRPPIRCSRRWRRRAPPRASRS